MVKTTTLNFQKVLIVITFSISIIVMLGWVFETSFLVSFITGSATMKFNTAFLTFLVAIISLFIDESKQLLKFISHSLLGVVFTISLLSLIENYTSINLKIDALLFQDSLSPNIKGRMSPATSVSFILIVIGIICSKKSINQSNRICTTIFFLVFSIAFVSFISFLLFIPVKNKILFFQTMSLPTTLSFIAISILLMLKYPSVAINSILNFNRVGSKLFWRLFPIVILAPILLSYILLYLSSEIQVNIDFGIALSTNLFILLSFIHLIYLSVQLNKSERLRVILEQKIGILKEGEIRESLLKETHHRVKNNFQIINSILGLQSNKSKDMELKKVLSDCQSRIRAISALHESIYVNGNFEVVKLDYFLDNIISSLVKIHSVSELVKVKSSIPDINMNMEYAMPLGLIVNELITNSLKHAFKTSNEKLITVNLKMNRSNEFQLIISDNGVGSDKMEKELIHPTSMGSELITVFTNQLEGQISVVNKNGLTYSLKFRTNTQH